MNQQNLFLKLCYSCKASFNFRFQLKWLTKHLKSISLVKILAENSLIYINQDKVDLFNLQQNGKNFVNL